jgi:hypothetical protein
MIKGGKILASLEGGREMGGQAEMKFNLTRTFSGVFGGNVLREVGVCLKGMFEIKVGGAC